MRQDAGGNFTACLMDSEVLPLLLYALYAMHRTFMQVVIRYLEEFGLKSLAVPVLAQSP